MQSLDVISFNLWQILISLCNLLILFFILKKFLYKPVKRILAQRQNDLEKQYSAAAQSKAEAEAFRQSWESTMNNAHAEAEDVIQKAQSAAARKSGQIVAEAEEKASRILRSAEQQAALEQKKAEAGIRREIVDVSALLAEKMLRREIHAEDHRALIDSVIGEIGDDHDADQ